MFVWLEYSSGKTLLESVAKAQNLKVRLAMYAEYKRNWSTDEVWMNPAVHENYPEWKKARDRRKKFKPSEVTFLNQHGDRFSKDDEGRVTLFRYRDIEALYSISTTKEAMYLRSAVQPAGLGRDWTKVIAAVG